jgi:hypothetical protein
MSSQRFRPSIRLLGHLLDRSVDTSATRQPETAKVQPIVIDAAILNNPPPLPSPSPITHTGYYHETQHNDAELAVEEHHQPHDIVRATGQVL